MKKLYFLSLIFMVMLSGSLVSAQQRGDKLGYRGDSGDGERGPGRKKFFGDPERMKARLGLTDEQVDKISGINLEYEKKFLAIKEKLLPEKKKLRKILLEDDINLDRVRELLKGISDLKIELRMLRINQRLDIEKVLTDSQKAKMKEARMKRIRDGREKKPFDE